MKGVLVLTSLLCAGCAVRPEASTVPMTTSGQGQACLVSLSGQQFVTERSESAALIARLRRLRSNIIILRYFVDAPYRCIGSAIVMLQRAKVRFRVPQFDPKDIIGADVPRH